MGARNIDELFRSGLAERESEVRSDSWSKMEMMLEHQAPKRDKKVIWYMAASVAVLIAVSFTYFVMQSEQHGGSFDPVITESLQPKSFSLPSVELAQVSLPSIPKVQVPDLNIEEPQPQPKVKIEIPVANEVPEEEMIAQLEVSEPELTEVEEPLVVEERSKLPIKVIYKRTPEQSAELAEAKKEKKRLKELINQAREFDASDVWADIRDAKEKVLDDPFGMQKTQRQKLK